jgi:RPA family protein
MAEQSPKVEAGGASRWISVEAAKRAAERINEINRQRNHVLMARSGECADVMPTDEMAAIIQEELNAHPAGAEMKRIQELQEKIEKQERKFVERGSR